MKQGPKDRRTEGQKAGRPTDRKRPVAPRVPPKHPVKSPTPNRRGR